MGLFDGDHMKKTAAPSPPPETKPEPPTPPPASETKPEAEKEGVALATVKPGASALELGGAASSALAAIFDDPMAVAALESIEEAGFGGDLGLMDINDADTALGSQMPQMKIVQKAEQLEDDSGNPGHFMHAMTGEQRPSVMATLLAQKFGRQWLDKFDGESGMKTICSSSDGKERDLPDDRSCNPSLAPPIGSKCAACPRARWNGKTPPECSELFSLLLYDHEGQEPVLFFVRRTAVKPWRNASTRLKSTAMRLGGRLSRRVPLNLLVSFEMTTEKVRKGANAWYEPRFDGFKAVQDANLLLSMTQAAGALVPTFAGARLDELDEDGSDFDFGENVAKAAPAPASTNAAFEDVDDAMDGF